MKKLQLSIKTLLVTAVLFISCSENEPDIEEICTSENYTVNFDRYVDETVRTPTNIGQIGKTTAFSYNEYNLLSSIYNYNIDNQNINDVLYKCNNNVSSMFTNVYTYNSENKLITSITATNSIASYNLIYNENTVEAEGILESYIYNDITLELNSNGLVNKILRSNNYSVLEYDANLNLIKTTDFDLNNTLLNTIDIEYDQNPNSFYGQLTSVYLDRILRYFNESTEDGFMELAFDTSLESNFPYFKNNILKIYRTTGNSSFKEEILKREFTYDNQNYPIEFEFITVGYHDSTVTITYK